MADYVNKRVAKEFFGTLYQEIVDSYDKAQKLWSVEYDDDNKEETKCIHLSNEEEPTNAIGYRKKIIVWSAERARLISFRIQSWGGFITNAGFSCETSMTMLQLKAV